MLPVFVYCFSVILLILIFPSCNNCQVSESERLTLFVLTLKLCCQVLARFLGGL